MRIWLKNSSGDSIGRVDVRDDVFDAPANPALVHQVVVGQLANARQGTASSKTRSEVSGGGRKPRPQKHTGLSRAGHHPVAPLGRRRRGPSGPSLGAYRQRTPRKMRRLALVTVLSEKARTGDLVVVDSLDIEDGKTSRLVEALAALEVRGPALLSADGAGPEVLKAAKNIPQLRTVPAALINTGRSRPVRQGGHDRGGLEEGRGDVCGSAKSRARAAEAAVAGRIW